MGMAQRACQVAADNGLHFFSSPFDETAVDHLEKMDVPVYKLASFEIVDIKLVERIASTGKPVIASNGMTDYLELDEAIRTLRAHGNKELAILHCNSGYPALFEEANLLTIPALADLYDCPVGLSDHTLFADSANYREPMAHVTPLESVKLGAKVIEVHLTLDRAKGRALMEKQEGGFDWPFSREPEELKLTIDMIRAYERGETIEYKTSREKEIAAITHGKVCFEPTAKELNSRAIRPTLWVVEDIKAGQPLKFAGGRKGNVDSLRPGGGLHIRFADFIDGRKAACDIPSGTPLSWEMVAI
jgi:sialic acid synthase SpsE